MSKSLLFSVAVIASSMQAVPAEAYPIDCAILLCLAGGFPPSGECTAARAEMIRRITPWPIEPPIQLWNCPMGASFQSEPLSLPSVPRIEAIRFAPPLPPEIHRQWMNVAFDPEVQKYLDAIKVYHLRYSRNYSSTDQSCNVWMKLEAGSYDANGDFAWFDSEAVPGWLYDTSYTQCSNTSFKGVGMTWMDYEGNISTEVVKY